MAEALTPVMQKGLYEKLVLMDYLSDARPGMQTGFLTSA